MNWFPWSAGLHQDFTALLLLPVGGDGLALVHTLLHGLVLAHFVSLLPGDLLHIVITAGLSDRLAGGGGDVLAVLRVDILGYLMRLLFTSLFRLIDANLTCDMVLDVLTLLMGHRATDLNISVGADILGDYVGNLSGYLVTLLPWNIPAFFTSNISADLTWNIMAFLPGDILASLSCDGVAFISGNIFADLTWNFLACFPGNIFTYFPWDFMAALLRFIPTSLMRNLTLNHLRNIIAFHPWDISAFLNILGVALPVHNIQAVLLRHVLALLGGHVPALHLIVDLLAHLLGHRVALLLCSGGALFWGYILQTEKYKSRCIKKF
jgi:hypothetical protein